MMVKNVQYKDCETIRNFIFIDDVCSAIDYIIKEVRLDKYTI